MSESDPYYPSNEGENVKPNPSAFSARVPESVNRGVFSTGAIVVTGASEFVIDFILRMGRPHQVVARVILPHAAMSRVVEALRDNLVKYEEKFGACPRLPKPDKEAEKKRKKPTIQEIYDDLRLPDETLSGSYANGVMIGHSMSEFSFDFVTNFFPHSCVSQRVFLAAAQVPPLLDSLDSTFKGFQKRVAEQQKKQANAGTSSDELTRSSGDVKLTDESGASDDASEGAGKTDPKSGSADSGSDISPDKSDDTDQKNEDNDKENDRENKDKK